MKKEVILDVIVTITLMMFLYAGFSKYFDYGAFKRAMYNQPFPEGLSHLLIVSLPPVEIIAGFLLLPEKTRKAGLMLSLLLMTAFTLYIAAILLHFFPKVPCSCGGIIRLLTWNQHLYFNLFFLIIDGWGYLLSKKEAVGLTVRSNP